MGKRKRESNTILVRVQESYKFSKGGQKQLRDEMGGGLQRKSEKTLFVRESMLCFWLVSKGKGDRSFPSFYTFLS